MFNSHADQETPLPTNCIVIPSTHPTVKFNNSMQEIIPSDHIFPIVVLLVTVVTAFMTIFALIACHYYIARKWRKQHAQQ